MRITSSRARKMFLWTNQKADSPSKILHPFARIMVPFLMEDLGRMKALVRQAHRMVVDSLLQYAIVQWCLPPNGGASLPQVQRGLRSHRLLLLSLQAFLGILASSLKGDSARMQMEVIKLPPFLQERYFSASEKSEHPQGGRKASASARAVSSRAPSTVEATLQGMQLWRRMKQLCTDLSRVRRSHPSRWRYMQLLLHGASPNCQPPNRNGVVHSRAISDIFERHLLGHLVRIVDLATRLHAMSPLLSLRPLLIVATCCFLSPWFPKECGPLPSAAHHLPLLCALLDNAEEKGYQNLSPPSQVPPTGVPSSAPAVVTQIVGRILRVSAPENDFTTNLGRIVTDAVRIGCNFAHQWTPSPLSSDVKPPRDHSSLNMPPQEEELLRIARLLHHFNRLGGTLTKAVVSSRQESSFTRGDFTRLEPIKHTTMK